MISPSSDDQGLQIYRALQQATPRSTLDIVSNFLPHLVSWLQQQFPTVSVDLCEDAAIEPLHDLVTHPEHFQESTGKSLLSYLHLAARRDLLNVLRREKRHAHEPFEENAVALRATGGNYEGREQEPLQLLCQREDAQQYEALVQELRATLSEVEQQAFELLLTGERSTQRFALGGGGWRFGYTYTITAITIE
jgi:DNA-directed RNA polymerase specialized sigma24 family protein